MTTLLKGGIVVNADEQFVADVLLKDGKVAQIGENLTCEGAKVIDITGKYLVPGGIDPHTHINMPFCGTVACDNWYTGTRAAAAGGTTCLIDFVSTAKGVDPKIPLTQWEKDAKEESIIDYSFHLIITEWTPQVREALEYAISHGINSAKIFLAYKGALMFDNDADIIQFFDWARDHGVLPQVHCEDGDIVSFMQDKLIQKGITAPHGHPESRPSWVEGYAARKAVSIASAAKAPVYIVHNTCIEALDVIEHSDDSELPVFGEATIAHLCCTDDINYSDDFDVAAGGVLSPPLRKEKDRQALWSAVRRGIIKVICTDHCPFTVEQKKMGLNDFRKIPNGVPALEERMTLTWSYGVDKGLISPQEFVAVTSTNCAKIFGMYPRKGAIKVGSDADVVVIDPKAHRIMSKDVQKGACDHNLFEGIEVHGIPVLTFSNGRLLWECNVDANGLADYKNGKLSEEKGKANFISRKTFVPTVYGRVHK